MPYQHNNKDPNLNNLHHAMVYRDGEPHLRVDMGSDNITINGDINVDNVTVDNTEDQPVPIYFPNNPTVNQGFGYGGTTTWKVDIGTDGQVTLKAGSAVIGKVSLVDNLGNNNDANHPVYVSANISNTEPIEVSGNVTTTVTFPDIQKISKDDNANSTTNRIFVTTDGTVTANVTFPETQQVSGTVALDTATLTALENVTVAQGTTPWTVTGTVNTIPAVITGAADAFGRLRVSEPYTLGDYSHVYGEELELLTKSSGVGAGATSIANIAAIRLTVGTGNGDYVIHQSRMYHQYMPGKSQLVNASFCFGAASLNVAKRVGYFGNRNGVYFQQRGDGTVQGEMSIVMRSFVTGSIVDTPVYQNDPLNTGRPTWNIDPLDGTGPSGYDIDLTRSQLLFVDFQWLGVGRVRVGFVHDGLYILAHEFYHTNDISTVYWSLPSQPIRCEIRNLAATTSTASMDQMCATVMSEGGYKESGVDKAANCAAAIALDKTSPNNRKGVMAIRLKNTYQGLPNRSIVRVQNIDLFADAASCRWEMWRLEDPSAITGGTWVDAGTDSVVEYNTTMGTSFNLGAIYGEKVNAGWLAANNPSGKQASGSAVTQDPSQAKRGYISQNIDSTGSNIYLIIMENLSTTATTNVYSAIQWRETR